MAIAGHHHGISYGVMGDVQMKTLIAVILLLAGNAFAWDGIYWSGYQQSRHANVHSACISYPGGVDNDRPGDPDPGQSSWPCYNGYSTGQIGINCDPGTSWSSSTLDCISSTQQQQEICNNVSGTTKSSGFYDMGTSANTLQRSACESNGCLSIFQGRFPAKEQTVNGVTHYFAQGEYVYYQGSVCTTGGESPTHTTAVPDATCSSSQYAGTVNGKSVCLDSTTHAPVNPPKQSSTQYAQSTDSNGVITNTTTITNYNGTSTTITTTTYPDGSSTREVSGDPSGDKDASPCDRNPDSAGCAKLEEIEEEGPESNEITLQPDFDEFNIAGQCPSSPQFTIAGQTAVFDMQPVCDAASNYIRPFVLLAAAVAAYLIFVGGLRT